MRSQELRIRRSLKKSSHLSASRQEKLYIFFSGCMGVQFICRDFQWQIFNSLPRQSEPDLQNFKYGEPFIYLTWISFDAAEVCYFLPYPPWMRRVGYFLLCSSLRYLKTIITSPHCLFLIRWQNKKGYMEKKKGGSKIRKRDEQLSDFINLEIMFRLFDVPGLFNLPTLIAFFNTKEKSGLPFAL